MIRVLQMIGGLNAGMAQDAIMNVYRKIDRNQMQFDFVLDRPNENFYLEEAKSLGAKIYTMPAFNGANAAEIKRDWNNFFYTHPEYKVLHSHVPGYASLYLPLAKKHEIKTIVHSYSVTGSSGPMAMALNALQYPLKKQADVLMACSKEAGIYLYGDKAVKGDKFMLVPNCVDLGVYGMEDKKRGQSREELGFDGTFVVGHIGSFTAEKNHAFLLEAFAMLRKEKENAKLLLIGAGPLQRDVAMKAVELGVAEDVILTGKRSDLAQMLSAMDVFALPSQWELSTDILVKAQATGLPCLISQSISDSADISPLVKRLPTDSAEDWAKAILAAGKPMDVSEKIIKAGFDSSSVTAELKLLYKKLHKESKR